MEAAINALCGKVDTLITKVDSMEAAIRELKTENAALRADLSQKDAVIAVLKDQVNNLEQFNRTSTVRVIGLPVTRASASGQVNRAVYENLIVPVFQGAVEKGELAVVPPNTAVIEAAYTIPSRADTSVVILKFSSVLYRNVFFRYKKEYEQKTSIEGSTRERPKFPVYEDMTAANNMQFKAFKQHERTTAVWTYGGQIKFRIENSERIYKVRSLSDTVDSIISR